MKQPMLDTMKREKFDYLYTPFTAMNPLLKHMLSSKRMIKVIWECCDSGNSKITSSLKEEGFKVISTDKDTGFDFLTDTPDFDFDMIITNPPFSLKTKFIERCYYYGKPFALLLPITALEGIERGKIFRKNGGISVIVLDKRVDFTGKQKPWFNASWFVHDLFMNNLLVFEEV